MLVYLMSSIFLCIHQGSCIPFVSTYHQIDLAESFYHKEREIEQNHNKTPCLPTMNSIYTITYHKIGFEVRQLIYNYKYTINNYKLAIIKRERKCFNIFQGKILFSLFKNQRKVKVMLVLEIHQQQKVEDLMENVILAPCKSYCSFIFILELLLQRVIMNIRL